ncbi:hypothetical protein VCHENC01_1131B, partial [Vibrio harveyi]
KLFDAAICLTKKASQRHAPKGRSLQI